MDELRRDFEAAGWSLTQNKLGRWIGRREHVALYGGTLEQLLAYIRSRHIEPARRRRPRWSQV
jgi:hypothetical protein